MDLAIQNAEFIEKNLLRDGGRLLHTYKDGRAAIPGYLEDYAQVIQGFRHLYEITFEERWLEYAGALTRYTLRHFFDQDERLFFFTDAHSEQLIARKKELLDNVISSSNSVMANNLFFMGTYFADEEYLDTARDMLARMSGVLFRHPQFLGNWACLLTCLVTPTLEVAIVGDRCREFREALEEAFHPNRVFLGTDEASELPLLKERRPDNARTTVYVCRDRACRLPVHSIEEARQQIHALAGGPGTVDHHHTGGT